MTTFTRSVRAAGLIVLLGATTATIDAQAAPTTAKPAAPKSAAQKPAPMPLTCDGPFNSKTTVAALRQQFGVGNVKVHKDEEGSVQVDIFAGDPYRAIEATFSYDQTNTLGLRSLAVRNAASAWVLPGGLKMGDSLDIVQGYNGKPFQIWGFGGKNDGTANGFDGRLGGSADGRCTYYVTFAQKNDTNPALRYVQSDDADARALKPVISGFGIQFSGEAPAQ